jgi:hypothetical protein
MTDLEQKAREVADKLCDALTPVAQGGFDPHDDDWLPIITTALRSARNEALEAAAKVAQYYYGSPPVHADEADAEQAACADIATRIRALKDKENPHAQENA